MRILKRNTKTKVESFDDTGEIQVVPIDTVVGDGGSDLAVANDSRKNQAQGIGVRGYKNSDTSISSGSRWREPDIVA